MVLCDHDLNIDTKLEMSTAVSDICALTQKTTGRSKGWKPMIYILVVDDSKLIQKCRVSATHWRSLRAIRTSDVTSWESVTSSRSPNMQAGEEESFLYR